MRRTARVALVAMTVAAATAAAQPRLSFNGENGDYPVGVSPIAVTTGDVNSDGKPDLVVANNDSDEVSVLLGNGDGTFLDIGVTFAVGQSPVAVAVGDFNNDGKPDIITADEVDNTVSVLLNQSGTVFGSAIATATGSSPEGIAVADFNGDGKLDVVTADSFDDTVSFLPGNGDGTFGSRQTYALSASASPLGVTAADLDGDGKLDIAVANNAGGDLSNGTIGILKGVGDGTFIQQPDVPLPSVCGTPSSCGPVAVAVADVNGDGKQDLLVLNQDGDSVSIFLGNGDLTYQQPTTIDVGSFPTGIVAGDFNADGLVDIATTSSFEDNVTVLIGAGDGTFATAIFASGTVGQTATMGSVTLVLGDASSFPSRGVLQVGDQQVEYTGKNGNTLDLASVLVADVAAGTPVTVVGYGVGTSPAGIAKDDFNGDQKPDLVTANEDDDTVSVLLNTTGQAATCTGDCDGNGQVTVDELITMVNIALGSQPVSACQAGDADGNGTVDIGEIITAVNNALNGCAQ